MMYLFYLHGMILTITLSFSYSHFNESRIRKCKDLIQYSDPDEIAEKVLISNVLE